MINKLKHMLLTERVPAAICLLSCTASVFMGFIVGYILFATHDHSLVYAESPTVYHTEAPNIVIAHTENPPPLKHQPPVTINEPDGHLYVVSTLNGYIVVYHAEHAGGEIKELTSTAVESLSQDELEMLAQGIRIYSEEALARILQDYGS